ncbi:FCGBP protein, partial [Polypterus senegalus]
MCDVRNGALGCHPREVSCSLKDGVISTFDGMNTQIEISGVFDLALLADDKAQLEDWFRVAAGINNCKTNSLNVVHSFFGQNFITVTSTNDVWVNGKRAVLPYKVTDNISVSLNNGAVVIKQTGKVSLKIGAAGDLSLTIQSSLFSHLAGFCGSANNDLNDDMRTREGYLTSDQAKTETNEGLSGSRGFDKQSFRKGKQGPEDRAPGRCSQFFYGLYQMCCHQKHLSANLLTNFGNFSQVKKGVGSGIETRAHLAERIRKRRMLLVEEGKM